jgi:hypothetical protein
VEPKPAVPSRTERPPAVARPVKDFVVANALENILAGGLPLLAGRAWPLFLFVAFVAALPTPCALMLLWLLLPLPLTSAQGHHCGAP